MKNQLKRSRVLNGVLAGALALVVVGSTAVVGAVSNGFQDWGRLSAPVQVQTNGTEEVKSGFEVSNVQENGIRLMSATIDETNYEDYGISPLAESAITLTATVLPANATHQVVTWSVRWKDSSDIWASSQTVTDYVTVQSIGDKKATVSCLQAFASKIEVVATMKEDSSKTATCTVDYIRKMTNVLEIEIENSEVQGETYFTYYSSDGGVYSTREFTNTNNHIFDNYRDGVTLEANYTSGTKSTSWFIQSFYFYPSDEVIDAFAEAEIGLTGDAEVLAFGNYLYNCLESFEGQECQRDRETGFPVYVEQITDAMYAVLCDLNCTEIGILEIEIEAYGGYIDYMNIPVLFDSEDWEVAVSSVALDSTEITF